MTRVTQFLLPVAHRIQRDVPQTWRYSCKSRVNHASTDLVIWSSIRELTIAIFVSLCCTMSCNSARIFNNICWCAETSLSCSLLCISNFCCKAYLRNARSERGGTGADNSTFAPCVRISSFWVSSCLRPNYTMPNGPTIGHFTTFVYLLRFLPPEKDTAESCNPSGSVPLSRVGGMLFL